MRGEALKGHLDLLLLAALREPSHGYAVIETLRARSGGAFDLAEGTVYPALHRLEQAGLVRSRWSEPEGRKRRVYAVTAEGRRRLVGDAAEFRRFAASVERVLEGGTP